MMCDTLNRFQLNISDFFLSGKAVTECGIFVRNDLGASPDGLPDGDTDWLLEIKTRSSNCAGPLQMIEKYMYIQVLLQLYCSKRLWGILMSYHPETQTANYFYIPYDHDIVSIIVKCLKAMCSKCALTEADRWDCSQKAYDGLWSLNFNIIPDFLSLKGLRRILTEKVKVLKPSNNVKELFVSEAANK